MKHKESESESEGTSHAEEPRFRIRVCMKRFHSDERARVLLSVCARRRVRWLQRRLRRLFALPPAVCLLSRGHLLPPGEPLALLDRDDLVEVVPVREPISETPGPQDVVDSIAGVPAEELQRSPAPQEDLSETKRQALLVLEQYCTAEVTPAGGGGKPRRRRVRRRRRVPPAFDHTPPTSDRTPPTSDRTPATSDRTPPAPNHTQPASDHSPYGAAGDDENSIQVSDDDRWLEGTVTVFREPEVVVVLRNELQPRAPRVVRPLGDAAPRDVRSLGDAAPRDVRSLGVAAPPDVRSLGDAAPRDVRPSDDAVAWDVRSLGETALG